MARNKTLSLLTDHAAATGPKFDDPPGASAPADATIHKGRVVSKRKAASAAQWSRSGLPRLLSIGAVAIGLDLSEKTVRRWIDNGKLSHHRVGRQIRITEYDLRDFLARGRRG